VKLRFADRPHVYNRFLDIMKDFKAQHIDTPGVIQRVSTLFKGHRELILGFNTFLPPGYRIDARDLDRLEAMTPAGAPGGAGGPASTLNPVTSSGVQQGVPLPNNSHMAGPGPQVGGPQRPTGAQQQHGGNQAMMYRGHGAGAPQMYAQGPPQPMQAHYANNVQQSMVRSGPMMGQMRPQQMPPQGFGNPVTQQGMMQMRGGPMPGGQQLGGMGGGPMAGGPMAGNMMMPGGAAPGGMPPGGVGAAQKKQPEFDHARNYVKKIKMRFASKPHVYKAFLEILHIYHKEQHTIKDVYDQVAALFAHHTDLLEEFTQFLPDPSAQGQQQGLVPPTAGMGSMPGGDYGNGKGRGVGKQRAPKRPAPTQAQSKAGPPGRRRAGEERMVPNASYSELQFFYKVKKRLANEKLYQEFLKCLNLFSQDIVGRPELVRLVGNLLEDQHPDLFQRFREFIGYDDASMVEAKEVVADESESDGESKPQSQDAADEEAANRLAANTRPAWSELDWSSCRRFGPSYRRVPDEYPLPVSTARGELPASVLNDNWISMPTGMDDYGFRTARKNQYEEMLFRCEDDRFELDLVIELNSSLIRNLEPIARQIADAKLPRRAQLPPFSVLHERALQRTYAEKGEEILRLLTTQPFSTVPVVLARLKQKDAEWRRAKREWNRVWREVNEKNYAKSLDHQSFIFRQADRKNLSSKMLLTQVKEAHVKNVDLLARGEDGASGEGEAAPMDVDGDAEGSRTHNTTRAAGTMAQAAQMFASGGQPNEEFGDSMRGSDLVFDLSDEGAVSDAVELLTFSADKYMSKADSEKIDVFLKHFLRPFLGVASASANNKAPADAGSVAKDGEQTKPASGTDETASKEAAAEAAGDVSPKEKEGGADAMDESPDDGASTGNVSSGGRQASLFFGNSTFYVFLRLMHVLTSRLALARRLGARICEERARRLREVGQISGPTGKAAAAVFAGDPVEEEDGGAGTADKEGGTGKAQTTASPAPSASKVEEEEDEAAVAAAAAATSSSSGASASGANDGGANAKASSKDEAAAVAAREETAKVVEKRRAAAAAAAASLMSAEDAHRAFMTKVYGVSVGSIDQPAFEDSARKLLGVQSYPLFTIDRVISQLTRQLAALLSDETCSKLLALHAFEAARPTGADARSYLANAHVLLSTADPDDMVFSFAVDKVPSAEGEARRLFISLLDESSPVQPAFGPLEHRGADWEEYLERGVRVFLGRNKEATSTKQAMKEVVLSDGLQVRVATASQAPGHRLFFVDSTEDVFFRPSALSHAAASAVDKEAREKRLLRKVDMLRQEQEATA